MKSTHLARGTGKPLMYVLQFSRKVAAGRARDWHGIYGLGQENTTRYLGARTMISIEGRCRETSVSKLPPSSFSNYLNEPRLKRSLRGFSINFQHSYFPSRFFQEGPKSYEEHGQRGHPHVFYRIRVHRRAYCRRPYVRYGSP